jgi:hypothetical protein
VTDTVTVVGDLDEFEAAVFNSKVYGSGRGVQTVLDELLYGGHRTLDDFAGGDSVNNGLAESLDFGWLFPLLPPSFVCFRSD